MNLAGPRSSLQKQSVQGLHLCRIFYDQQSNCIHSQSNNVKMYHYVGDIFLSSQMSLSIFLQACACVTSRVRKCQNLSIDLNFEHKSADQARARVRSQVKKRCKHFRLRSAQGTRTIQPQNCSFSLTCQRNPEGGQQRFAFFCACSG